MARDAEQLRVVGQQGQPRRGANSGILNNCTLSGNSEGGAAGSTLNNCILYFNMANSSDTNYDAFATLNYCCTTPDPGGIGNITKQSAVRGHGCRELSVERLFSMH